MPKRTLLLSLFLICTTLFLSMARALRAIAFSA